ncbi:MAG TPA: (deoxy)nucleoside triphosphate pyrophosphohydrolase [Nocardioidaceae bacterium]|nr:(deoxy)nucleoside triphosphate pyrophosphohydrolase [Nocardioidaceae bacterium]
MSDTVVVGVAIIDAGRVLAARRVHPPATAGRWEFPGGKVEPGESLPACAVREISEELGCRVAVCDVLDASARIKPGYTLQVVTASLVSGEPIPHEHDAIRWLDRAHLRDVDWLEPDLPFLPLVEGLLR